MSEHLTPKALEAALAGDRDARRALAAHLERPCDVCQERLSRWQGPDLLEGAVDQALGHLAPAPPAPMDEVGFARIRRRLRDDGRPRLFGLAGMAAALLLVVLLGPGLPSREGPQEGVKGGAGLQLELSAAASLPSGELVRIESGAAVPKGSQLLLRYHASEAAASWLVLERAGGARQVLGAFVLEPGTHDLVLGGRPAAVRLDDEVGPVRLWLWARPGPTSAAPPALEGGGLPPGAVGASISVSVEASPSSP